MGEHMPDKKRPPVEVYRRNNSIFVSTYVKHKIATYSINRIECCL